MKVNAITLRPGNVIDHNSRIYIVLRHEIIQPGKGNAVIQLDLRDLRSGNKDNMRFRTQETVERVRLEQVPHQFLYAEGDVYNFMNNESYEQITIDRGIIGDQAVFLTDGMEVVVESYEGESIRVELPDTVVVTIVEAEPVVKGQTASSSYKPAILENGVRVMVPPHIESGTRIVVKTEDFSYVERARD
jgi:elongation factor P